MRPISSARRCQEEKATDEKLTALAKSEINVEAEEEPARPRGTSGRRSA